MRFYLNFKNQTVIKMLICFKNAEKIILINLIMQIFKC